MRIPARPRTLPAFLCVLLLALVAACSSGGARSSAPPTGTTTSRAAEPPLTSTPAELDLVAAALAALDRRQQIAQLFVVGLRPADLPGGDSLAASGVGGVFLAGRPDTAASDLAMTTARWQSLAPGPDLWVAADQEGGDVQSLQGPGFERLPPAVAQGELPPGELAALAGRLGAALHGAGVNLDLAPVVDVVPAGTEGSNEPIGHFGRQYGSTGPEVTVAAGTVMDGLAANRVTASLKHFPGLGRVQGNTDTSAEVIDSVTAAGDEQVTTFATLVRSPAHPFVMASSATYTQIDPANQAAFSAVVLTELLREQLDFDGVIISDDLGNARAVGDVPEGERAVRFLAAGGTLVLVVEPSLLPAMVDAVLERSAADPAFSAVVDAAVQTALLAKAHAGLLPG
jgi:beta-glucosidase-like glycosyl hydrolase